MSENEREISSGFDLIYAVKSKRIWGVAKNRIRSLKSKPLFDDGDDHIRLPDDETISLALKVIDILKMNNIVPSRVINGYDGDIAIDFHRWNIDYDIEIGDSEIIVIKDKKRCFYRRNKDGNIDCEHEVLELPLDDFRDFISGVKKDTFEDFVGLIKMFIDFPEQWHVNYHKSNRFSKEQIKRALRMLNFLGNRVVKPNGIFPIVSNCDDGDVSIRICFNLSKSYMLDILENDNELSCHEFFECDDKKISLSNDELEESMTKVLLGKMVFPEDKE